MRPAPGGAPKKPRPTVPDPTETSEPDPTTTTTATDGDTGDGGAEAEPKVEPTRKTKPKPETGSAQTGRSSDSDTRRSMLLMNAFVAVLLIILIGLNLASEPTKEFLRMIFLTEPGLVLLGSMIIAYLIYAVPVKARTKTACLCIAMMAGTWFVTALGRKAIPLVTKAVEKTTAATKPGEAPADASGTTPEPPAPEPANAYERQREFKLKSGMTFNATPQDVAALGSAKPLAVRLAYFSFFAQARGVQTIPDNFADLRLQGQGLIGKDVPTDVAEKLLVDTLLAKDLQIDAGNQLVARDGLTGAALTEAQLAAKRYTDAVSAYQPFDK